MCRVPIVAKCLDTIDVAHVCFYGCCSDSAGSVGMCVV